MAKPLSLAGLGSPFRTERTFGNQHFVSRAERIEPGAYAAMLR
jgi:hypothetical protein